MIKKIKKIIKILINYKEVKDTLSKEELIQFERVQPWFAIQGDETLRIDYDLDSDSIVFDLGGYKGQFSSVIYCKYGCNIYVFEPVKMFFETIKGMFSNNHKVKFYNFGLGGKNEQLKISLTDNASSVYLNSNITENITLKSIVGFIKENNIRKVDLIKINIEGGEYEVLEALIENGLIHVFKNIQVQFHDFIIGNAKERMNAIQARLLETHKLTYQYEFVWENWELK